MKIIVSEHRRAEQNLALEQKLLSSSEEAVLFYVNDSTVVVGRNQTIEAEVDLDYCKMHGIEVVRRLSGGGAVYHDSGNLNYAIICDGSEHPLDRNYTEPIVWALRELGVDAVTGSRGEITVDGVKISGSACMVHRGRVLFHGTLLFDANLQMLDAALKGDETRRGKGVKSIHSQVGNLKPLLTNIPDITHFIHRLRAAVEVFYSQQERI